MDVFFDTEFTSLDSKLGYRGLISTGCVSVGGETFYAELSDTWNEGLCSAFVVEHVLPLLQGGDYRVTEADLAARLKTWVEGLADEEVVFRTDAPRYDWPWVEQLFTFYGCWPRNLRRKYGTIYFDDDAHEARFEDGLALFWDMASTGRHHALMDAQSQRFAWLLAARPPGLHADPASVRSSAAHMELLESLCDLANKLP